MLFSVLVMPVAFAYGQDEDHTAMLQRKIKTTKEVAKNYAEVADEESQGDVMSPTFWESRFCKSSTGGFIEVKDTYEDFSDDGKIREQRMLEQEDACTKQGWEDIVSLDDCKQATKSEWVPQMSDLVDEWPEGCIKLRFRKGFAFNHAPERERLPAAVCGGCPSRVDYCIWKEDVAPECKDQCTRDCEPFTQAPGGTSCPPSTRIDDARECRKAAKFLGKRYQGQYSDLPRGPTPAGCFVNKRNGRVYHNPFGDTPGSYNPSGGIIHNHGGLCKWKSRP